MYIKEAVSVGPSMAQQWLDRNHPNNRAPKPSKIRAYTRDMKSGSWVYPTGELLKFDTEGRLVDGQNRLKAVVEAETSIQFDVAYDVPDKAKYVIDSGAGRSFGDALSWSGARNRNNVGALVRWIIAWEGGVPRVNGGHINPTHGELKARYDLDPLQFDASTSRGLDLARQKVCNPAAAGVAHYLLHQVDAEASETFFDALVLGAGGGDWKPGNPILELRNRLIRGRTGRERDSRVDQLALIIRAWNAWREGRTMGNVVVYGRQGLTNENFPKPI